MSTNPGLVSNTAIGKALPRVNLLTGRTLLLEGPASARLKDGQATVLGAPLSEEWVIVREDHQIPVETPTGAELEIRLGYAGKYKLIEGSTIPTIWREASQIIEQSQGTIVIVGDVDSGKSTLSTLLANKCHSNGLRVGIIDGDVGQADIGPPTTISAVMVANTIFNLQELSPLASRFMGHTSPSSIPDKLNRGLVQLKKKLERSEVLLVNTDGWVQGDDALRYKARLLRELDPQLVLGISSNAELDNLLDLQKCTVLKLNRSIYARTRSREERKKAREFGYKRFLQKAKRVDLKLRDVKLRRSDSYQSQLRLDTNDDLRGVLAGLLDEKEDLISIGRVQRVGNGLITLTTAMEEFPTIVELGAVVLSSTFEETSLEP